MSVFSFSQGEDDTYVIVENLKLLLSHYNASSPVHLGTGYFNDHSPGGASYVLSREALRRVNEEGYRKVSVTSSSIVYLDELPRFQQKILCK